MHAFGNRFYYDFGMTKKLFAKFPVLSEKELKAGMTNLSKTTKKSFDESLDIYIKGIIGDIASSQEIILREEQRIKKAKKCIVVAKKLMSRNESNSAKLITEKYYNDLLTYAISKANSRVKI